jgi:NADPH:quinone reductase-like Zn-dependent oxidoreductase
MPLLNVANAVRKGTNIVTKIYGGTNKAWPPAEYQQTFETVSALTDVFDIQQSSNGSIATDQFWKGSKSLKFHQTGSSSASAKTLPTATQTLVGRFRLRTSSNPNAGTQQLVVIRDTPTGVGMTTISMLTSGVISVVVGSGSAQQSAAALAPGTWHTIDFRLTSSGTTWTVDCMVDGVALTQQASQGGKVATNATVWRYQNSGANTWDWWVDNWQISHISNDYPLTEIATP